MRSTSRHAARVPTPRRALFVYLLSMMAASFAIAGCSGESPTAQTSPALDPMWQVMHSRTNVTLRDVWGSSSSDVFAVGDGGTILHFNGLRWAAMSSPTTETLRAVSGTAPDNVYAAGDNGTALHYDGTAWTALDPQTSNDLGPVDARGEHAAFADRDAPGLLHHYDSAVGFIFVEDTGAGAVINDMGFIPETLDERPLDPVFFLAADGGVAMGGGQTLEAGSADLVSVIGTAPGNAFVLGADGTLWSLRGRAAGVPVASTGAPMADAVLRSYDDILMFGASGRVFRYDRCGLSEVRSGVASDFLAAWGAPDGKVFAVGVHGEILRYRAAAAPTCPDNIAVRISAGVNPTISWSPPCPVSKVMVTGLEGYDQGDWFVAADGNSIEPGLRIGEVPACATELRPQLGAMMPGTLYRLTLVRRDVAGDVAVGFYNFRPGDAAQTVPRAVGGPATAPNALPGVYVQPLGLIVEPEPGQPLAMQFIDPEQWPRLESTVDGVEGDIDAVIRALVRDPDTGEMKVIQLDDIPVMRVGDSYAVDWPRSTD
jgi:hypothetical protein